jgi:uncharacterized protein YhfF
MNGEEIQLLIAESITFKFGDSEELCDELLRLIRSGNKTATCGALYEFGPGKNEMPVVGRRDIALNWDGSPALLLETLDVTQVKFCDVDESFALAEGENDDLPGWWHDHRQYFERNGGFDTEMILVCERFALVRDFGSQGT